MFILLSPTNRAGHHRVILALVHMPRLGKDDPPAANCRDSRFLFLVKLALGIFSHGRCLLLRNKLLLLCLQRRKLRVYICVDIIGNVLSVHDLGYGIEPPRIVLKIILFTVVRSPDARASIFPHEVSCRLLDVTIGIHLRIVTIIIALIFDGGRISCPRPFGPPLIVRWSETSVSSGLHDRLGNEGVTDSAITCCRVENLETMNDIVDLAGGDAGADAGGEKTVTGGCFNIGDSLFGDVGHGH
mmetsp:Transcript_24874/g.57342  ORF Transcript_24874/g.57342 Transcript_24874/m.57342 type:complete len:243 (+) Transcript_24874:563-1291(+)